jgi:hypothetical protein
MLVGVPVYVADSSRPVSAIPSLPAGFFLGKNNEVIEY